MTMVFMSSMLIILSTENLMKWMIMEFNSLFFLMWMLSNSQKNMKMPQPIYLMISFMASSMFMMYIISNSIMISNMMILMKMAIPPFHSWLIMIMEEINMKTTFTLLSIQKIIPMMLSTNMMKKETLMLTAMIWSLMLIKTSMTMKKMKQILSMSSISMSIMLMIASTTNKNLMMMIMMIYSMNLLILMKNKQTNNMSKSNLENTLTLMNLSGMPPMPMFFLKMSLIKWMVMYEMKMLIFPMISIMTCMMFTYNQNILMMMKSTMLKNKMKNMTKILNMIMIMMIM